MLMQIPPLTSSLKISILKCQRCAILLRVKFSVFKLHFTAILTILVVPNLSGVVCVGPSVHFIVQENMDGASELLNFHSSLFEQRRQNNLNIS